MILIISDRDDTQVYSVTHFLDRWGLRHVQWNVSEFPTQAKASLEVDASCNGLLLELPDGQTVRRGEVRSVWYRKPNKPQLDPRLPPRDVEHASAECRRALSGIFNALDHVPWISRVEAIDRANDKLLQLRTARALGFTVPDTLVTNDPVKAWEFHRRHGHRTIYKPLSAPFLNSGPTAGSDDQRLRIVYTTLLEGRGEKDFESVRSAPCLFQPYIDKAYELRVTVVDGQVFAARIDTQHVDLARCDWRRDMDAVAYSPYPLPAAVEAGCRRIVERLGLRFGAIDLICTPEREYVFLEINPNGQFGWVEERAALPISEAIARALTREGPPSGQHAQSQAA